jgi:SPP1 gp7 family putative phage head morphogenesis protein
MPVHAELIQIANRQQVLLEQLKSGQARDFLSVFTDISDQIRDVLKGLDVSTLDELSRTKLDSVIRELENIQSSLLDAQINKFQEGTGELAHYIAELEVKVLKSVASKQLAKTIAKPKAEKVAAEVLKRPVQATGDKLEGFLDNWSKSAIRRTSNAVRVAYEQGKTVPEVVSQLLGTQRLRYKDGVMEISRKQATTVVRTAVQHVASTARAVTYEENADLVEGYQWVSTLDKKTTAQCRALDGQEFELGKGPMPPIHHNCRSTTTPSLIKEFDFLDKGATRSSQDGYVDADMSYYDWLKTQDQAFQDQVLGTTRGKLFRDGGLSVERFTELQLDKNFDPITLDEMRKLEPLAFKRAGV